MLQSVSRARFRWPEDASASEMLRVTVNKDQDSLETWELEGKLSGDWVAELERCWIERAPGPGVRLEINLKAVSFIDASGKRLLKEMHGQGVEIKGCGCMTRAVVEEITRQIDAPSKI